MTWTDARVALLRRMWADGCSASRIAEALGGTSRNAVCGKVDRLGLGRSGKPRPRRHPPKRARIAKLRKPARRRARRLLPGRRTEELVIPAAQRCSLIELRDDTCRWPIGDVGEPGFFFCGGQPVAGFPYCAHHCGIAYRDAADERPRERRPTRSLFSGVRL